MSIDLDNLRIVVPQYLSLERQKGLVAELEQLSGATNFFSTTPPYPLLQGDVWCELPVYDPATAKSKRIKGLVLSNSCDISADNTRFLPVKVSFSPLVSVAKYQEVLKQAGWDAGRIENHLSDLRRQAITSLMYIPASPYLGEEYIALLSDIHSVSLAEFDSGQQAKRLSSFNNVGFYVLLFKLAVHFCRMHEGVDRDAH
ncbi:hypothetical protein SOM08_15230 [Hydrogenophaga sp. SNF1]|uniref:hypothetical protein n=1 Tax=Hydrogenophaga sp. SNF1 TaxID=3098762 RepID=UPI002ACC241D|nr:hypothetical protein [Hydrogenophaga sp. SNF1]WQB82347.1 hypothetical protein SOM08_15230 [Hydrogenophaga sp. SNF1]